MPRLSEKMLAETYLLRQKRLAHDAESRKLAREEGALADQIIRALQQTSDHRARRGDYSATIESARSPVRWAAICEAEKGKAFCEKLRQSAPLKFRLKIERAAITGPLPLH